MNGASTEEVSFETREQLLIRSRNELKELQVSLWAALKEYLYHCPGSLEKVEKLKKTIQLHKRYLSFLER